MLQSPPWATGPGPADQDRNEQDRTQVGWLAADVQAAAGEGVEFAYVDQGYTDTVTAPAEADAVHGIKLEVIKLDHASSSF